MREAMPDRAIDLQPCIPYSFHAIIPQKGVNTCCIEIYFHAPKNEAELTTAIRRFDEAVELFRKCAIDQSKQLIEEAGGEGQAKKTA